MREVASSDVAAYLDLVESQAKRFVGRAGAEFDDLVQEGLISVWEHLSNDLSPSVTAVQNAMRDWIRKLRRLNGG